MNQLKSAALAAALGLAYAGTAAAEVEPGFYAGVGVGQSTVENDDADFDEDDTGFKLFGGYQFNPFFAVELAYINGGEPDTSFTDDGSFTGVAGANVKLEAETSQINAAAVGTYAFNDYFGVMGRLGLSYVDAEIKETDTATLPGIGVVSVSDSIDDDTTELAYGVGVWFSPVKNFVLRLEYEMTSAELFDDVLSDDTDLTLITVSAAYRFGR
jgi:OOP family OmpA-OmpF porin